MRIVFATFGSLGDIHPVIAIGLALQRRGHHVTVATSEFYREKISVPGFTFAPLRPELAVVDEAIVRRIMDGKRGSEFLLRELMLPAVRDMYADLVRITAGADLLVSSELVYAAPLIAAQTGLRWVSYSLAPISLFSTHDPCVLPGPAAGEWMHRLPPPVVRALNKIVRAITYSWWRPVREFRRELGLPPGESPIFAGKHSPLLDLALFSSVLQSPQPDWPAASVQTGFCFHDESDAHAQLPPTVETFLSAGDAPIVFTLGSAAVYLADNFYTEAASAAKLLGRRALLLVGKNPPPANLPSSILAWDYLPYAQVFPRAAAIVHQGGVGTTAQALRAGRPMVIVPFAHDQFDNAARVTRGGSGRTVARSRCTARNLTRALAALLSDPRTEPAADRAAARVQAEPGAEAAAVALERALA